MSAVKSRRRLGRGRPHRSHKPRATRCPPVAAPAPAKRRPPLPHAGPRPPILPARDPPRPPRAGSGSARPPRPGAAGGPAQPDATMPQEPLKPVGWYLRCAVLRQEAQCAGPLRQCVKTFTRVVRSLHDTREAAVHEYEGVLWETADKKSRRGPRWILTGRPSQTTSGGLAVARLARSGAAHVG